MFALAVARLNRAEHTVPIQQHEAELQQNAEHSVPMPSGASGSGTGLCCAAASRAAARSTWLWRAVGCRHPRSTRRWSTARPRSTAGSRPSTCGRTLVRVPHNLRYMSQLTRSTQNCRCSRARSCRSLPIQPFSMRHPASATPCNSTFVSTGADTNCLYAAMFKSGRWMVQVAHISCGDMQRW